MSPSQSSFVWMPLQGEGWLLILALIIIQLVDDLEYDHDFDYEDLDRDDHQDSHTRVGVRENRRGVTRCSRGTGRNQCGACHYLTSSPREVVKEVTIHSSGEQSRLKTKSTAGQGPVSMSSSQSKTPETDSMLVKLELRLARAQSNMRMTLTRTWISPFPTTLGWLEAPSMTSGWRQWWGWRTTILGWCCTLSASSSTGTIW